MPAEFISEGRAPESAGHHTDRITFICRGTGEQELRDLSERFSPNVILLRLLQVDYLAQSRLHWQAAVRMELTGWSMKGSL